MAKQSGEAMGRVAESPHRACRKRLLSTTPNKTEAKYRCAETSQDKNSTSMDVDMPGSEVVQASDDAKTISSLVTNADIDPIVTKSFYGKTSRKYMNPLERKILSPEPVETVVPSCISPAIRKKTPLRSSQKDHNTKVINKSQRSSSKALPGLVGALNSKIQKPNESNPCIDDERENKLCEGSPRRSPRKRKFFKHREESPSKRKRSRVGIAIQLHKGVTMNFTPKSKKAKSKTEQLELKPRKKAVEEPQVEDYSQDLFSDLSEDVPSTIDSGCNVSQQTYTSSQPNGTRSNCSENWSVCSNVSDSVNLISDASSPVSQSSECSSTETKASKLFPIFNKRAVSQYQNSPMTSPCGTPSSAVSSPSVRSQATPKQLLKKTRDKEGREQMMLDFGQKLAGAVQCATCGMTYSHGEPTDEATHSNFHQKLLAALKFKGWKKERVEQGYPDGSRIIMVLPDDKVAAKKVAAIRTIVDEDLGFVVDRSIRPKSSSKTYLYISSDQRVIGCCVAEVITKGYRVVGGNNPPSSPSKRQQGAEPLCCATEPEPAKCGISRIWVLSAERKKGIASRLLDTIRNHFVMGYQLVREDLAFTDPTPDGRIFASRYTDTPCFLVYKHT